MGHKPERRRPKPTSRDWLRGVAHDLLIEYETALEAHAEEYGWPAGAQKQINETVSTWKKRIERAFRSKPR